MELLELYRQILQSLGCPTSPEGLVSTTINGSVEPLIVTKANNKRLTLPTPIYLENPQEDIMVQFHPMSEGFDKGESEVLTALKRLITSNLMFRICDVLALTAKIAANPELQQTLKPTVTREFSKHLKDFDKKSYNLIMDILGKINPNDRDHNGRSCTTINITLARRVGIFDKQYQRAAVVSFPLLEAIDAGKEELLEKGVMAKIFGVTPGRKNQYDLLLNLFNFVFPEADVHGSWSAGSNSLAAPYFHALLLTYVKIAERLNTVVKMLSKNAEKEHSDLLYNLTWKDAIEDLSPYVGRLPLAQHNKGKMAGKSDEDNDDMKTAITRMTPEHIQQQPVTQPYQAPQQQYQPTPQVVVHQQPVYQQPQVQQPQYVNEPIDNGSNNSDPMALINKINSQRQQPMHQPQMMYQNGQMVPVMAQPQPQVVYANAPQMVVQPPMVQDPMVQVVQNVPNNYGQLVQVPVQMPLSQFQMMVQTGQIPNQQPQILNQQPMMNNGMMQPNPSTYVYQDGVQPMMNQPQMTYQTVRPGGRPTVAEREQLNRRPYY